MRKVAALQATDRIAPGGPAVRIGQRERDGQPGGPRAAPLTPRVTLGYKPKLNDGSFSACLATR